MGCDIHAFVEYALRDTEDYTTLAEIHIERDYELFGHMAGVRRDYEPVTEPRGIPSNLDVITRCEYKEWEGDAHHASWLSFQEMSEVLRRMIKQGGDVIDSVEVYALIAMMTYLEAQGFTTRLVFWFDN